ncbi:hypothetical protein FUAX_36520 [Fulvitalea axinellae]|uniref:Peptidase n=1 Tax=Fulvitalea axinellae TaxID=1182444 RepID=A0AAU9DFC7_9BACT|nr:hypothetical protein FUAX_36520 [Fulvitalea axinellae]
MKWTSRQIHRDFSFFYLGLIIAFSFSGIILNHRKDWYPMDYTYEQKSVELAKPKTAEGWDNKGFILGFSKQWDLAGKYDGHRLRKGELRVYYKSNIVLDVDTKTGKGELEYKRKVPFVGHTMLLHKSTSDYWIWYSDIFGVAMLVIAITGMMIPAGKNGFGRRGWKLALAGIVFPLVFLFLLV